MIKFNSNINSPTFKKWKVVNGILFAHTLNSEEWRLHGYEGVATIVKEKFNFTLERDSASYLDFCFDTEQDYALFLLKWL
jgi:hypothetical protein